MINRQRTLRHGRTRRDASSSVVSTSGSILFTILLPIVTHLFYIRCCKSDRHYYSYICWEMEASFERGGNFLFKFFPNDAASYIMNIQEYIDSGVLEAYCLGALTAEEYADVERMYDNHEVVKHELNAIRNALGQYAAQVAITPPDALSGQIWNVLDNLNKENAADLHNLPVINRHTDYKKWKAIVLPFAPQPRKGEFLTKVLRHTDTVTQVLIVATVDVPDEVHTNELESFIVLEGECECIIGDKSYRLSPGQYIEIPLHTHHDVQIRSAYVMAIMQRIAV